MFIWRFSLQIQWNNGLFDVFVGTMKNGLFVKSIMVLNCLFSQELFLSHQKRFEWLSLAYLIVLVSFKSLSLALFLVMELKMCLKIERVMNKSYHYYQRYLWVFRIFVYVILITFSIASMTHPSPVFTLLSVNRIE